jgi:hypothetical protein
MIESDHVQLKFWGPWFGGHSKVEASLEICPNLELYLGALISILIMHLFYHSVLHAPRHHLLDP